MLGKWVERVGWCSPAMADTCDLHPGKNSRVLWLLEFNSERGVSVAKSTKFPMMRKSLRLFEGVEVVYGSWDFKPV